MVIVNNILKKPPLFVLFPIGILFVLLLFKWQLSFPFESLWFFVGGVMGIYILDIAEELFNVHPSPFRSVFFMLLLSILTFYILSSTKEFLAMGLCLLVLLEVLILYIRQWRSKQPLDQWYSIIFHNVPQSFRNISGMMFIGIYSFLCLLFVVS
jgi:hypothetical protein